MAAACGHRESTFGQQHQLSRRTPLDQMPLWWGGLAATAIRILAAVQCCSQLAAAGRVVDARAPSAASMGPMASVRARVLISPRTFLFALRPLASGVGPRKPILSQLLHSPPARTFVASHPSPPSISNRHRFDEHHTPSRHPHSPYIPLSSPHPPSPVAFTLRCPARRHHAPRPDHLSHSFVSAVSLFALAAFRVSSRPFSL